MHRSAPLLLALTACAPAADAPDACPDLPAPTGDVVTATLPIDLVAGDAPLALGAPVETEAGVPYRVQKLKLYVSELALVRDDGSHVHPLLVDGDGEPLPYGVHLVDAADPASLALTFRAPRGDYAGVAFTIGVPDTCPDEVTTLNHADASAMLPPLDVDSDMYWSWNPGYVSFKIEGRAGDDGSAPFFYHVGGDDLLSHVVLDGDVTLDGGEASSHVVLDADRLFVTPEGDAVPRLDGDDADREAHSGPLSEQLHRNLEGSHVLALR
jgi:hypothetical protein